MPSTSSPHIHNFTLKKYSKFTHNTWSHHPYRTDLSITFIQPAKDGGGSSNTDKDIEVVVHWKGVPVDKYTLFVNDRVRTSILVKSPNIGIKQCHLTKSGDLIFRFQISLVDDAEFEKCHSFLRSCQFKHTNSLNMAEAGLYQGSDASSQIRQEVASLNFPHSPPTGNNTQSSLRHVYLTDTLPYSPPKSTQFKETDKVSDLLQQNFSQHSVQSLWPSQIQACLQPSRATQLALDSQTIQYGQELTSQSVEPTQTQSSSQQQLQQQFLQWQQNYQQQLTPNYSKLPQPHHFQQFVPPISEKPLPQPPSMSQQSNLQNFQPPSVIHGSQATEKASETSTTLIDSIPLISINNVEDLKYLTDSELSTLIKRQCQSSEFRNLVKRLDNILEKNS
ncbi:hypothetical protein CANMA_000584 [Candida margitis]|uniref:uncharacterized protein n=1 Tax=Candida margitis TaxID=1775924 RepID=UPI002226A0A7|nr:uncharacterized protein CANMA_000584 [Candida margitis]KAI5970421.1 hypothetical protein CANMA_000584 [Candida margitis]